MQFSIFPLILFLNINRPEGIVIGILLANGQVDEFRMGVVRSLCLGLTLTFHRAFEFTTDPIRALESIIKLGKRMHGSLVSHD
jgi:copper homeostasis protein CutC